MKKVLLIVAPVGFRDEEALEPKKVLEGAGHTVVVGSKGMKTAKGMLGAELAVDVELHEVNVDDYDAVAFVGGPGASGYFNDADAHRIAQEAVEKGKILAAICIAPAILGNAGLLSGRRATIWDSGGVQIAALERSGAKYSGENVTVDGKLVTANGPAAATAFGKKIVELLS